jgi:small subunit ribosomal protein S18
MARPRTRTKREDRDRKPKKKISILDQEGVGWVDYKDVNLLRRFMSERAKIRARRVTGNDSQQQRAVARAIRVAREMALLPYSVRQTTSRSKGGKGGRDRGEGREGVLREVPGPSMEGAPPPPSPPSDAPDADVTDLEVGAAPTGDATDDAMSDGPVAEVEPELDAPVDEVANADVAEEASS